MKSITNLFQRIPFYPLLLGFYPVLFLWAANFNQVSWDGVGRSLIIAGIIALIVCLICLAILRNLSKAAALAGLMFVLFYTFGHVFNIVNKLQVFGFSIGRYRNLLLLWGVIFVGGAFWILRTKSNLRNLTFTINLVSSFLIAYTLVQLGNFTIINLPQNSQKINPNPNAQKISATQSLQTDTPDVYYIVLDGYDREDLLKQDMHLDNSQFISALEGLGFVVPNCTTSNYDFTLPSMGATLNMNYLDALGYNYSELAQEDVTGPLTTLTKNNLVMQKFKDLGYKIITLKTIFPFINFPNSDIVYDVQADTGSLQKMEAYQFQYVFMMTTMMQVIISRSVGTPEDFINLPQPVLEFINPLYDNKRGIYFQTFQQNLYQLEKLKTVSQVPGKKFLYAHLLVTHTPFVFTSSGSFRTELDMTINPDITNVKKDYENITGYKDQITFVDGPILTIVKNILAQSKTPPIIILQGDHGNFLSGHKDDKQFEILNAYYLPGKGKDKIYPTITPVNSFRLIFSTYFNQDYPLLPDRSIFFDRSFPTGYEVVPQNCMH